MLGILNVMLYKISSYIYQLTFSSFFSFDICFKLERINQNMRKRPRVSKNVLNTFDHLYIAIKCVKNTAKLWLEIFDG